MREENIFQVYDETDNKKANDNLRAVLCRKLDQKPKICH